MDDIDKQAKLWIIIVCGIFALFFIASMNVFGRVNNATTREELQKACSNLSIQSAPVRCLELQSLR